MAHDSTYEPPAYEQESEILNKLKAFSSTNPKKIKKYVTKLHTEAKYDVQKIFCIQILESVDPVGYIKECITTIEDCALIIENMISESNHGMMFVGSKGKTVLPVRLNTLPHWLESNDNWHPDDEIEIQRTAFKNYLEANNLTKGKAKVVLFPQFGFSGVPRMFEV